MIGDAEAKVVEAVLMVAPDPVEARMLAELLEMREDEVVRLLEEMAAAYEAEGRGFCLVPVAGGYRFQSHPELIGWVERFVVGSETGRLSPASLEVLAIVAYRQPLSKAQVSSVRGVSSDGVVRALAQRGYIAAQGRDNGPGQAVLYGTTQLFLEHLGISTIAELPPLADFVPDRHSVEALETTLRADDPGLGARYGDHTGGETGPGRR
ncbi:MAG: SMC-Scp complex subunit ScpB [Acidimicrobiales bacterium]